MNLVEILPQVFRDALPHAGAGRCRTVRALPGALRLARRLRGSRRLGEWAAFGYLRSLLNHLTPASRLPRALGIAATLNELTFVLGPVAASGLGAISPVFAVLALTVVGAVPILLIPDVGKGRVEDVPQIEAPVLNPSILLWLACAAAGGSTVAVIEIGAVALALKFGYEPTLAILFTVPLCLASVGGGIWVSVRNRMASRRAVVVLLSVMTFGAGVAAFGPSLATTVIGIILIGVVLAPLGTYYSLVFDQLAPPSKRAEVFALLRTANAIGIIFASAVLTAVSLPTALTAVTCMMLAVTLTVGLAILRSPNRPPQQPSSRLKANPAEKSWSP